MNRLFVQFASLTAIACSALVALTSCADESLSQNGIEREYIDVEIAAEAVTRTTLGDNGQSQWSKGDKIVLWAYSGDNAVFSAQPFTMWHRMEDFANALFKATISPMGAGSYNYHALYPIPTSTSGTTVSYDIPATQSGEWQGDLDILHASAEGSELVAGLNDLTLNFKHKIHALKITIPEGRNLFGRSLSRMRIKFPKAVAGTISFDLRNNTAAPTLTAASSEIYLDFATPKGAGDTFWVYIVPTDLTGGEIIFTATDGVEYSYPISTTALKSCQAGHITPIDLTINTLRPQQDYTLTIDHTQLGEPVTEITSLTLPDGYCFPSLDLNGTTGNITSNGNGTFNVKMFSDIANALQSSTSGNCKMTCGSLNTVGVQSDKCPISNISSTGCTIKAPYLFFENFSGVTSFSSNDAYSSTGILNRDYAGVGFLNGWSGARVGASAGLSVRIACRRETATTQKHARVDSAPLANIRSGSSVSVKVVYDYGMDQDYGGLWGVKAIGQTCYMGSTNDNVGTLFSSDASNGTFVKEFYIKEDDAASWNNVPHKDYDFTCTGCNNTTRIVWRTYPEYDGGASNNTCWFYIDNVRVSIAQ